jgi:hypothetical protein
MWTIGPDISCQSFLFSVHFFFLPFPFQWRRVTARAAPSLSVAPCAAQGRRQRAVSISCDTCIVCRIHQGTAVAWGRSYRLGASSPRTDFRQTLSCFSRRRSHLAETALVLSPHRLKVCPVTCYTRGNYAARVRSAHGFARRDILFPWYVRPTAKTCAIPWGRGARLTTTACWMQTVAMHTLVPCAADATSWPLWYAHRALK